MKKAEFIDEIIELVVKHSKYTMAGDRVVETETAQVLQDKYALNVNLLELKDDLGLLWDKIKK